MIPRLGVESDLQPKTSDELQCFQGEGRKSNEKAEPRPDIFSKVFSSTSIFFQQCLHAFNPVETGFRYPKGEYVSTLKRYVKDKDEKQLKMWVEEYSKYVPTQILFGKYFISIKMLENYMTELVKEARVEKTDTEIAEALASFIGNQKRKLLLIFHPDKLVDSGIDPALINECANLITRAGDELEKPCKKVFNQETDFV